MSQYQTLKTQIQQNIKQNGEGAIRGDILQTQLLDMINALGAGYQFIGVATPTNPGTEQTPDYKCFYLATTPGRYTNLGGLVVADGEVALLKWDTSWTKEVTGIATADELNLLGQKANLLTLNRTGDNVFDENYIRKDKIVRSSSPYDIFDYANAYLTKYYRIPSTCKKIVVSGLYGDADLLCRFSKEPTDNAEAKTRFLSRTGDSVEIVMSPELFAYPYVCFVVSRGTASPVFTNATITFGNQIDEKLLPILGSDAEVVSFPNVGYIAWSTGVVQSSGYHSTELIPVYAWDVITMSGMSGSPATAGLAAYDENGDYLQSYSIQGSTSAEREYIVPVGVSFVRLCTNDSTINTSIVSVKHNPMFVKVENVTDSQDASDEKIPTLGVVKEIKKELSVGLSYGNSILTTHGYLMYTTTGNPLSHTDFDCGEEYYPVTPGQRWRCLFNAQGSAGVCFYNAAKIYLNQYWQSDGAESREFVVPENAAFVRFCNRHTVVANPNFKLMQEAYDDLQTLTEEVRELKTAQSNDKYQKGIIRLYPKTKLPCVSFQFDDSHYKDDLLVSLFESYNLTCAFAFIASTSNITNKAETYKGYQKRGFQIMNHSVDGTIFNTTNYTYETALETIRTALYRIEDAGMVCNGFVSPSSSMASEFKPILGLFQSYAFTDATTSPTANGRGQDRCDLHRYSLESHTIAEIEQYIDDCITNDQIMTFYGHAANLIDGGDASVFSLAKIAEVIEYCIAKRNAGTLYVGGTDDCVKYFFDL